MRFPCSPRIRAVAFIVAAFITATIIAPAATIVAPAFAEDLAFPASHHPWGRFPAGSWKLVRTTLESLDEKGHVASVTTTETRSTLVSKDDASYTLLTDAKVDVASRRITATPQTVKHGYYGEAPGQSLGIKRVGETSLTIDGRSIPCEIRQVVLNGDNGKQISNVFYTDQLTPFVLRRETSVESAAEEKQNSSLVEVVALDLPQRIRGELKPASYIKTTQKLPRGSKVTLEVHCDDVPGGVAAHWASELDTAGRVVRRSTLELLDYGLPAAAGPTQPAVIRRPVRQGKAARRMDPR
jgi:hypothetical protein